MEISLSCHHRALNVITFVTGNRTHFDLLACQTIVRYLGMNYMLSLVMDSMSEICFNLEPKVG